VNPDVDFGEVGEGLYGKTRCKIGETIHLLGLQKALRNESFLTTSILTSSRWSIY
jgi:hypothetical protein